MEIKLLRSFVTVARLKNFSAAARELNTVQPAVSRHISELEAELNTSLFWRNTREVHITAAGQVLLQEALDIIAHEERARTLVKLAATGKVGRLRIGYLGPACYLFLPELVREFSEIFPDVLISLHELTAQQQLDAFEKGNIDIGFSRPLPQVEHANFEFQQIYSDRYVAFLPNGHWLAYHHEVCLKDLADERFILFSRQGAPMLFQQIVKTCQDAGFVPNVASEPATMQTVLTEVAAGLGVSIAPRCILRLTTNKCQSVPIRDFSEKVPLEVHVRTTPRPAAVDAFMELAISKTTEIQQLIDK